MNILVVNFEFPPLGGGGGIFTRDLVKELARKHAVDVLTTHYGDLKRKEAVDNYTIYRVPVLGRSSFHTASMFSMLLFPISGAAKGIQLLRNKKYDVINTHFAVPTGPAGLILSRFSGVPNVLSLHGGYIYDPTKKLSPHRHAILRWAVRSVINSATKVVAQSTNTKRNAEEIYRPDKSIDIIPLGMPEPRFSAVNRRALSMQEDKFYLISIGRLVKRKGYDTLITALSIMRQKEHDARLILMGDGPERHNLESQSAELNISDRVTFLGAVSDERKFQYLSASDLYVLSSLHEGFGIVLLEAMFCGLAIVSTNDGGQVDIIKDGRNGVLVQPSDADALANAISALLKDSGRRQQIGATNKSDVKQYTISAVTERYLNFFNNAISS